MTARVIKAYCICISNAEKGIHSDLEISGTFRCPECGTEYRIPQFIDYEGNKPQASLPRLQKVCCGIPHILHVILDRNVPSEQTAESSPFEVLPD